MGEDWKKGLTKEQLIKVAELEFQASANLLHQEVKDLTRSDTKSVKKNVVLLMQEAPSASTDPGITQPAMSQSPPTSSSSIPNSQSSPKSDTSLNVDTHNSRYAASLAQFITENENKDITANLLHRASVVANTSIKYEKNQLLQLIHGHLVISGLNKTAEMLKNESGIVPLSDSSDSSNLPVHLVMQGVDMDTSNKVSLGSIVSEYLSSQHALCRSPMATIPKFDLLQPHKCPGQRPSRAAAPNFTARQSKKGLFLPCRGRDGSKLDRKLIYSRFRPVKSFLEHESDAEYFTSCAFSGDSKFLFSGTTDGKVKVWNLQSNEKTSFQFHNDSVDHILSSKDSQLLITSTSSFSKLWNVGDKFELKKKFKNIRHLEFSNLVQDKVVGTQLYGVTTVYDLQTGQASCSLKPTVSNDYRNNRATFDPSDTLILSDGVLWDFRAPRQLHCFDKLDQTLSDAFHPSGLEIISNTEVWDIRTFRLLRTVSEFDRCRVVFNSGGEVIFANFEKESEINSDDRFLTSFKTHDSSDYSLIATIKTENNVAGLCSSWDDRYLAVNEEETLRLYDVGMPSTDEEDQDDGTEEDHNDPSEDQDDSTEEDHSDPSEDEDDT